MTRNTWHRREREGKDCLIVIIVVIEATALLTRNRGKFFQPKESNDNIWWILNISKEKKNIYSVSLEL